MKELGNRLRTIRKNLSLTQGDFADKLGITKQTLLRYEKGLRAPGADILLRIVEFAQINPEWLLTGKEQPDQPSYASVLCDQEPVYPSEKSKSGTEFVPIPQVSPASAGEVGEVTEGEIIAYKYFEKGFISQFKDPLLTTVHGDSMLPMLHDGDLVLIDRAFNVRLSPNPNLLYLVNCNDQVDEVSITVKRVSINEGKLICFPLNSIYKPIEIDLHDRNILGVLLGRVVWFARTLV